MELDVVISFPLMVSSIRLSSTSDGDDVGKSNAWYGCRQCCCFGEKFMEFEELMCDEAAVKSTSTESKGTAICRLMYTTPSWDMAFDNLDADGDDSKWNTLTNSRARLPCWTKSSSIGLLVAVVGGDAASMTSIKF